MINKNRFTIKIGGESGQGINSIGEILAKALKNAGYKVFAYREYPSLIRGGCASYQIDLSDNAINSSSENCDLLVCLSRVSVYKYLWSVNKNGGIIHILPKVVFSDVLKKDSLRSDISEKDFFEKNNITVEHIDANSIAKEIGGSSIFANIILAGLIWKLIKQEEAILKKQVTKQFAKKEDLIDENIKSLSAGYNLETSLPEFSLSFRKVNDWEQSLIISGNEGMALGAIAGGTRAYYAYPMTPATSILANMAKFQHESKTLIKQAEDEITAVQMAIGSMYMGTRALVATSGGGFDLMTESISLSGMTETPLVLILAQRAGPATGLPTWTGAADLNIALYAGHGEYPRCVLAASDVKSAFSLIQHALNIAEEYQMPVIILTEKQIAESLYNIKKLPKPIEIKRGLVSQERLEKLESKDRFRFTKSGVSPRWLPGVPQKTYIANSDEHTTEGKMTEEADETTKMIDKRMRKLNTLLEHLPDPKLIGEENVDTIFIGWGSVNGTMEDVVAILEKEGSHKIAYLHYDYIYPLKTELLLKIQKSKKRIILIENNMTGQLGQLITRETGYVFKEKLLKYNGRPFFIEDVLNYLNIK